MSERSSTDRVLFPGKWVPLANGDRVFVEPWGLATGKKLGPVVADLLARAGGVSAVDFSSLVRTSQEEVEFLVRETLGLTKAEADEKLAYEDLFTVFQAVVEVCLLREDGGGVLGKVLALAGRAPGEILTAVASTMATEILRNATGGSPRRSSSSSPADTDSQTSSTTPLSGSTSLPSSPSSGRTSSG